MKLLFTAIALSVSLSAQAQMSVDEACVGFANIAGTVAHLKLQKASIEVSKELLFKAARTPADRETLDVIIDYTYSVDFKTVEGFMRETYAACVIKLTTTGPAASRKLGNGA